MLQLKKLKRWYGFHFSMTLSLFWNNTFEKVNVHLTFK